jgi:periplasmic divalent cation tolerance protein
MGGAMEKFAAYFVTCADDKQAEKIAYGLLNEKLVACVNIVGGIRSLYWWQDKIDESKETLLIIKGLSSMHKAIEDKVCQLHSYDVPEVICLPIQAGLKSYLDWIEANVKSEVL